MSNTSPSPETQGSGGTLGGTQATGEGGRGQWAAVREEAPRPWVDYPAVGGAIPSCGRGQVARELTILETRKGVTASSQVRIYPEGPRLKGKQVELLWAREPRASSAEEHPTRPTSAFAPYPLLPGLAISGCCVSLPAPHLFLSPLLPRELCGGRAGTGRGCLGHGCVPGAA